MSFTYDNQGSKSYLVYHFNSAEEIDSVGLGMITNNRINGLAQAVFMQLDSERLVKYDITAKVSAKQIFCGVVDKKIVLGVLNGIVDAFLAGDDYMIDPANILFDMDYIYVNVSTGETFLIYLPVNNQKNGNNLENIIKSILFNSQFNQAENCDYVAKIINYVNSSQKLNLREFQELLRYVDSNKNITQQSVRNIPPVQSVQPKQKVIVNTESANVSQKIVTKPQQASWNQLNISNVQSVMQTQPAQNAKILQPQQMAQPQLPPKPNNGGSLAGEDNISWINLMSHYSKENKELYQYQKAVKKAQKEAKKQGSQIMPNQNVRPSNVSFAIPGQPPQQRPQPAQAQPQNVMPQQPQQQFVQPQRQFTQSNQPQRQFAQPQPMPQAQQKPVQQVQPQPVQNQNTNTGMTGNPSVPPQILENMTKAGNFGETTVLGVGSEAGETTVLGASQAQIIKPYLLRIKNNERIELNKPVFRIGKERSYVDYFVSDNTAVSRSHANIINKDNEFYIVDTNSTNHTYVNGSMIQSNVETKIEHGTKIRLANEDFEFFMY
ncbi:MAG TPA: hypothetical protein DCY04_03125 [Eubacterium sp.]|nr:hypothetical protein [Eubacterium sp.]